MERASDAFAIREAWSRIERWLDDHAPGIRAELRSAVAEGDLDALERSVGLLLPVEVKASWRIHDGTSPGRSLLHGRELLSARGMRLLWQRLCRRGGGRWHAAYLPFAADGLGDFLCLDLTSGGRPFGRVVEYWPDRGHVLVVAPSFRAWLEALAGEVESVPVVLGSGSGEQRPALGASRRRAVQHAGAHPVSASSAPAQLNGSRPTPTIGDETRQAEDLLTLLARRDLLVLTPGADLSRLARAVCPALQELTPPPERAEALVAVLLDRPEVDELFADDETLAAILDAW